MQFPMTDHWKAAKRILRYIKGTLCIGLEFRPSDLTNLQIYVDSDWADDLDDRRSMTGSCIFFGPNLVTWMSRKQSTVSRSSAEAEYRAIAYATAELRWFCQLLRELGVQLPRPPLILSDIKSALFMVNNPVVQARTRHMEIDYHYVREFIANKSLRVQHVSSESHIADLFTKALSTDLFHRFRRRLNLVDILPS